MKHYFTSEVKKEVISHCLSLTLVMGVFTYLSITFVVPYTEFLRLENTIDSLLIAATILLALWCFGCWFCIVSEHKIAGYLKTQLKV